MNLPVLTALNSVRAIRRLDHLMTVSAQKLDDGGAQFSVVIDDVDFVRETTRVSVRYTLEESAWQWTSPPLDPAPAEGAQS